MKALQCGWLRVLMMIMSLSLFSCTRASMQELVSPLPTARTEGCDLHIFMSGSQSVGEIQEVCAIESIDPDMPIWRTQPKKMIERAFNLACYCGADGVMVDDYTGTGINLLAFRFKGEKGAERLKGAITAQTFEEIIRCRYRQGAWSNGRCTQIPAKSSRARGNVRDE